MRPSGLELTCQNRHRPSVYARAVIAAQAPLKLESGALAARYSPVRSALRSRNADDVRIDRHLMGHCCGKVSQIVGGHTNNDIRRCSGPIGSKRRPTQLTRLRRTFNVSNFAHFLGETQLICCRAGAHGSDWVAACAPSIFISAVRVGNVPELTCQWFSYLGRAVW